MEIVENASGGPCRRGFENTWLVHAYKWACENGNTCSEIKYKNANPGGKICFYNPWQSVGWVATLVAGIGKATYFQKPQTRVIKGK